MVKEKGLDVLLQAWAEAGLEGARLVLVGDGPERDALEALAEKLEIRDGVQFAGMQDELARYYAAADVFVMPSRTEGLPMALLEAGMAGRPVVVSDVGDMPGIVRESGGGWIVPAGDVQALVAALQAAAQAGDDALRRMGTALRGLVGRQYSAGAMAAAYGEVYGVAG